MEESECGANVTGEQAWGGGVMEHGDIELFSTNLKNTFSCVEQLPKDVLKLELGEVGEPYFLLILNSESIGKDSFFSPTNKVQRPSFWCKIKTNGSTPCSQGGDPLS